MGQIIDKVQSSCDGRLRRAGASFHRNQKRYRVHTGCAAARRKEKPDDDAASDTIDLLIYGRQAVVEKGFPSGSSAQMRNGGRYRPSRPTPCNAFASKSPSPDSAGGRGGAVAFPNWRSWRASGSATITLTPLTPANTASRHQHPGSLTEEDADNAIGLLIAPLREFVRPTATPLRPETTQDYPHSRLACATARSANAAWAASGRRSRALDAAKVPVVYQSRNRRGCVVPALPKLLEMPRRSIPDRHPPGRAPPPTSSTPR